MAEHKATAILSRRVSAYRIGGPRRLPHWAWPFHVDRWLRSWQAEADDWTDLGARRAWTPEGAKRRMQKAIARECRRTGQTSWCYCPKCESEMLHNCGSHPEDDGSVALHCPCGWWSWWDLDAPAPLLLNDGHGNGRDGEGS